MIFLRTNGVREKETELFELFGNFPEKQVSPCAR